MMILLTLLILLILYNDVSSWSSSKASRAFNPLYRDPSQQNVKHWFDNELTSFSEFVASKQLLSHIEEKQLGKSIKMALQLEKMIIAMNKNNSIITSISNNNNDNNDNNDINNTNEIKNAIYFNDIINDNNYFERILGLDERLTNKVASQLECTPDTIIMIAITADRAYEKLVSSNLRLVLAIVRRYTKSKVPISELIAEGTRGLSKAVKRYDFERGFRFATYATWYVTQGISDYVRIQSSPTKVPSRYILLKRNVKKFIPQYHEQNNRNPTLQEVCLALGTCEIDVVKCLSTQNSAMSMSEMYSDKGERTFEDILPSNLEHNPMLKISKNELNKKITKAIEKNLEKEEKDVLQMRLGLGIARAHTVFEVSKKYDLSWQKVRTLEKQAINKLLNSTDLISVDYS